VIAFSCTGSNRMTDEMARNPANPSFVPNLNFIKLSDEMTFIERVKNTAFRVYEEFHYQ
jgi:UDP-glucoronosyl and UDP-glucosyl transferase